MTILVIDGQGGRIGSTIISQLTARNCPAEIIAVGTNTMATSAMMKAGAVLAATGENPVLVNAAAADLIAGPVGIIAANSLLGEITPKMALAVSESPAQKILIPINRCNVTVVGTQSLGTGEYIAEAVEMIMKLAHP